MATEYKRMQQRNDTAASWSSINPVLAAGEIGYDRTNKKIKIGDGTTAWNALPYQESGYTDGNGIDITNDTITVDALPTQFTFENGKLAAVLTGDNGLVTNQAMNTAINSVLGAVLSNLQQI